MDAHTHASRYIRMVWSLHSAHIVFEEPSNRNNPTTEDVSVKESLTYTCTATNHDHKMWTDRYKKPILNTTDGRIRVTVTSRTDSLTINNITHQDSKEYYCFAVVYSLNESSPVIQELHLFRPVVVHGKSWVMPWLPWNSMHITVYLSLLGLMLAQQHFSVDVCPTLVCVCLDTAKRLRKIISMGRLVFYILLRYVSCASRRELLICNGYSQCHCARPICEVIVNT